MEITYFKREMTVKTKVFIGIAFFYIAFCVFPFFTRLIPPGLPGVVVCSVLISMYGKSLLNSKTMLWFLLYCIVTATFVYFGREIKIDIGPCTTYYQLIIAYAFLLPNILISLILLHSKDYKVYNILGQGSFLLLMLSFVLIIPYMGQIDLRKMALYEDYSTTTALGYTLLHAYIIIIPALFYCFTSFKNGLRWLYLIGMILTIYIIIKSSITTEIGILLFVLPLSIIFSSKNKSKVSFLIVLLIIIAYIFYISGAVVTVLELIRPIFEGTAVEEKIDSFQVLYTTGTSTGSIDVREEKHTVSIQSFFDNIIILIIDSLHCNFLNSISTLLSNISRSFIYLVTFSIFC